eukprot:g4302.t1
MQQTGGAASLLPPTEVGKPPRPTYKAPPPAHLAHLGGSQQVAPLVDHSKPPSSVGGSDRGSDRSRGSSDGERRHFAPRHSSTYEWKRHSKPVPEVKRADPVQGLKRFEIGSSRNARDGMGNLGLGRRHFAGYDNAPSTKHYNMLDAVGRRRRARDPNGRMVNRRPAKEQSLQALMGKKRRGYTLEMSRNGIPCKSSGDKLFNTPTALPGFYTSDNSWGIQKGHILRRLPGERPGVLPGSNWGFSRATQSTREDQYVFGRDLVSLWRRHQSIPVVILSCCERLEQDFMNTPYLLDELVKHKVPPADGEAEFKTQEQKQRENTIANLRRKCDSGMIHTIKWDEVTDPLVFIGLLAMFFSETKPPLCGAHNYDRFVDALHQENQLAKISATRSVIMSMPTANQTVLAYMVRFCRRLLEHANKGSLKKGQKGNLLSVDIVCQAFAPIFLRPFGHAIHDEAAANRAKSIANANSAEFRRSGNKKAVLRAPEDDGAGSSPHVTGESANVFAMLVGSGSREIFQSISLRAYDRPTVKRMSFEEKLKLKQLNEEKKDVDSLREWEKSTGNHLD